MTSALVFFLTPFLVRHLGTEGYGVFVSLGLFTIIGYAGIFEFGLQSVVSKYVAEYCGRKDVGKCSSLLNATVLFFAFVGVIFLALGILLLNQWSNWFSVPDSIRDDFVLSTAMIFWTYPLVLPMFAFSGFMQGLHQFHRLRQVELVHSLMRTSIFAYLLITQKSLFWFMFTTVLIQISQTGVLAFFCRKSGLWGFDFKLSDLEALREIRSLFVYTSIRKLFSTALRQGDFLILTVMIGPKAVAYYDLATKIAFVLKGTMGRLNEIVVPLVSQVLAQHQGKRSLLKIMDAFLRFQYYLVAPIVFWLVFNAPDFLRMWVADDSPLLVLMFRLSLIILILVPPLGVGGAILMGANIEMKRTTVIYISVQTVGMLVSALAAYFGGLLPVLLVMTSTWVVILLSHVPIFKIHLDFGVWGIVSPWLKLTAVSLPMWVGVTMAINAFGPLSAWVVVPLWGVGLLINYGLIYSVVTTRQERGYFKEALLRRKKPSPMVNGGNGEASASSAG